MSNEQATASPIKRVGIVGSGIMGSGIAEVAAAAGHEVVLRSRSQTTADAMLAGLEKSLARQVEKGRRTEAERDEIVGRVSVTTDLAALADCDLVIESVVEDLAVKKHLFTELDRVCGESAILATNTSTLPVVEMAMETGRPDKVCGVHFFNPAPAMALVEVVRPITASDETMSVALDFAAACGKEPVEVKDQAGFIVNALLFPYLNNAVRLLEQGVATREGIDAAMKGGCGFPMGPFALLDLVGLDTSLAILDALYAEFRDPNYAAVPLLRRMVAAEQLGRKSGQGFYDYRSRSTGAASQGRLQAGRLPAGRRNPAADDGRRGRMGEVSDMSQPDGPASRDDRNHRDPPWMMRTYSGHSSAGASNELYRTNLSRGQTGLSIAFDLPTQTGYDPDSLEAAGEVGKVGVPVAHLGHMRQLLEGIPVAEMNTSMTINATAAWLLGLYVANAEDHGVDPRVLQGTTQNDIVKEYLSRGTYIFGPEPSLRLTVDTIAYTVRHAPKWNPINVCSYHLQEAGATPVQEVAYALATAIGVLDGVRESGKVDAAVLPAVVGRISFFVNSGLRFVEETCKMRAFTTMWDRICHERYGVDDPKLRRFRYGVQVNSLGLTEQQPENNVPRIVLETLGVTLSRSARARAMQLPAWNEALGLPRPWDQQWSLRVQQILAEETDLLEYADLFDGSHVVEAKTAELVDAAEAELDEVLGMGGAFGAIDELKQRLVRSQAERVRRIESGEQRVVGVNCYTETAPSPLTADGDAAHILKVDPTVEAELAEDVVRWRAARDGDAVRAALDELERSAADPAANVMAATIALAHAGGTTGEWAGALRRVFGEYRAPTGVAGGVGRRGAELAGVLERSRALAAAGGPPRLLVAKPGLDGHSNGAEQLAVAARDAGFEVVYQGIRLTPAEIVAAARDEDVEIVGLSILSGSHLELVPEVLDRLREAGVEAEVVVGGIIPDDDAEVLRGKGVAAVYTPKDFRFDRIMADLVGMVERRRGAATTLSQTTTPAAT